MKEGGRRLRQRLRGACSGKTGKAVGITSVAAPIIGYVVNDLKKPDGLIRTLLSSARNKFLTGKVEKTEAIDITDQVEIIEDKSNDSAK